MKKIITTALTVLAAAFTAAFAAGPAAADETHRDSHNAPVVALVNTGQIDDPMEDVLEHLLLFGDLRIAD
ncbi:hypothetical protein [Streptomyces toxytricini]|uniref:hypothetical protein n=1 Tax=Streptomyces toxytricini TaxID=67369 RepID=UPI00341901C2